MWTLVSGSEPSEKNSSDLSTDSLSPEETWLSYGCFLITLPGQVWALVTLVQSNSTQVPSQGVFTQEQTGGAGAVVW